MSTNRELPPQYRAEEVEDAIYKKWEKSGLFNPDVCIKKGITKKTAKSFSVVLPPPNVTGTLHIGSASMLTIEDILVRYHRMKGDRTLWLPGTDHAAIATQAKVEGAIYKKEGKTRYDLGREELLRRIEQFAQESHDVIIHQMKKMGSSLDWSREAYTLDEKRNTAVCAAFKRMHDDGLIYRGARIVNWDPKLQTTVSDDEVEYVEKKSAFYYFKYGPFVIGTARPETKFGDKYVVVHPDDKRYAQYTHSQKIELEWINGPVTATIIKDKAIDMNFGTGVMTITPWHDAVDFEIAERHKLEKEQIIDLRGKLLPIAGEFAGMSINKARPLIIEKMKQKGLLTREPDENYTHRVAVNSRGGGTIEPQIIMQWFIDVNKPFVPKKSHIRGIKRGQMVSLKEMMRIMVKTKQIEIISKRFEKIYFHWVDNLRDWCISRQIWYGHRIPVWYCVGCGEPHVDPKIKGRVFLVRHGETAWNAEGRLQGHKGEGLNENGVHQIEEAARQLARHTIDLIVSSDLERTRQSAEIIADKLGVEVIFDEGFRERTHGVYDGQLRSEIGDHVLEKLWNRDHIPEGGESIAALEERVHAALLRHRTRHRHKNIVIVSHGQALTALLRRLKKMVGYDPGLHVANGAVISFDIAARPCARCGDDLLEQDPDTLDTWFSSGLWTFSTMGWPRFAATASKGKAGPKNDLANYHPTSVLETGYDILFFWVARMILMTGYHLGDIPFKKVYLHGLVRDGQGRKMSKSLGNIIDPLDWIAKYGADATRLSLIIGAAPGNDLKLTEDKVRGYRNFANKIWNSSRFLLMHLDSLPQKSKVRYTTEDHAMKKKLGKLVADTEKDIDAFRLHQAAERLYHFFWHYYADKVIEKMKLKLTAPSGSRKKETAKALLLEFHTTLLRLLHPFMPFVTEEIWSRLPTKTKRILMAERWPE